MKLVKFHQRSPIGGHHFLESDGTLIRAQTKDDLLVEVRAHRIRNGLHVGSPDKDIALFYLGVAPHWVEEGEPKYPADPLEVAALDWTNNLWGTRPAPMLRQDALKRSGVCKVCSLMKEVSESPEGVELRRRAAMISGGMVPPLGICTHHKWACSVACAIKEPDGNGPVEGCWAENNQAA